MNKFKLNRTKQCAKCPFKVSTNPHDIPNWYCVEKHKNLRDTIATDLNFGKSELPVMACHDSEIGKEVYCIGWLHNQLGRGNNIALRIKMMYCENADKIKVFGKQHENFENTLP